MKRVFLKKPSSIVLIIIIFILTSRIFLTVIGVNSRKNLTPKYDHWYEWSYSENSIFDIWGSWDTGWYLDIAKNGYSSTFVSNLPKKVCCGQNNFGFFPLYPILIKFVNNNINNYFYSALLISNTSLAISIYILYKLVRTDEEDSVAIKSIVFLLIFPTSFILSAAYSESLFLLLTLTTFYFAKKEKWFSAGISGFLLSLTKSFGILILIPLIIMFIMKNKRRFKKNLSKIISLVLIPVGLLLFMLFSLFKTGSPFYYAQIKNSAWQVSLTDPFKVTFKILMEGNVYFYLIGFFIVFEAYLVYFSYKLLDLSYFVMSLIYFLVPLLSGVEAATSSPRHAVVIFPFYIVLAKLSKKTSVNLFIIIMLLVAQAYFMRYFANGVLVR